MILSVRWLLVATFLLPLASPAGAGELTVAQLASSPVGAVVVHTLTKSCRRGPRNLCTRQLRRWLRLRNLHPLTRAALQRELAEELRVAGDREAGSRQTAALHYLRTFSLTLPSGEDVVLHADPVSGIVNVADFVELSTDVSRTFRATLESSVEQSAWLLVTGGYLERLCLGQECTAAVPMDRLFPDQFAVRVKLAATPATNDLQLVFSPQAPMVNFALRAVDGSYRPIPAQSAQEAVPPGWQLRAGKRSQVPEGASSGTVSWLPEITVDSPTELLLARCLAAHATGRNAGEVGDQLLARADELSAGHWSHFLVCIAGDERELEVLLQARNRFPEKRPFVLAEAAYRSRQRQTQRAWKLIGSLGQMPTMDGFHDDELAAATAVLRSVLPILGLSRVLQVSLEHAFRRTPDSGRLAVAVAEQLVERERHAEAATLLVPYVGQYPGDLVAANTLAYVLDRLGRFSEEAAIQERLSWLYPTQSLLLESLASVRERAGELEVADELFLTLAERGRYQPYLLGRAANYFLRRADRNRAVQLWQQVAALEPQDREVRALVRRLQENGEEREELQLATDEERRRLADALPQVDGASRQGVLDRTHLRLYPNGAHVLRRTVAFLVREEGAGTPFDFRFTYDSHLEEAVVSRAEVLRQDGTVAPAGETGDFSLSSEEYNLYYDLRQMAVSFTDLEAGDLAVVTYEIVADPSALGGPFSGVFWFQEDFAKANVELAIALPAGQELYSSIGPADQAGLVHQTIDDGDTERTWRFTINSLPADLHEPFPPGPFERSLFLHYSTIETWQQFAHWYASVIAHVGGLDAAMERLLERVAEGAGEPREVAESIARYVADEVRYVGLELGVHGLQPYPPQEVFARGFGDCKDKSLLYVTLMRAAGIEARLVVVPTLPQGAVDLVPGSPSVFNHAIVYLPLWDIYFDPTARYLGLGILPWQNQGANALTIDAEEPQKVVLPVAPYTDTVARFELTVVPAEGGDLAVTGTLTFGGQFAWRLLGAMEQQGSWKNTVESYLSSLLPVVEVAAVSERVERGESPAVIIDVEGVWRQQGSGSVQLLPDGNAAFALVKRPVRRQPLVFGYPYQHEFLVTFAPGTLTFPDDVFDASQSEDAAWRVAVENGDDGARVSVQFEQRARRITIDRYQEYRALVVHYQEALSRLKGMRGAP